MVTVRKFLGTALNFKETSSLYVFSSGIKDLTNCRMALVVELRRRIFVDRSS